MLFSSNLIFIVNPRPFAAMMVGTFQIPIAVVFSRSLIIMGILLLRLMRVLVEMAASTFLVRSWSRKVISVVVSLVAILLLDVVPSVLLTPAILVSLSWVAILPVVAIISRPSWVAWVASVAGGPFVPRFGILERLIVAIVSVVIRVGLSVTSASSTLRVSLVFTRLRATVIVVVAASRSGLPPLPLVAVARSFALMLLLDCAN